MNAALQRIQEERASCWNRMTEIVDGATREERDLTPEERTNWDAADKRLTELTTDKDRLQRQEVLDAEARSQGPVDPPFEVPEQRTGGDDPEKRLGLAFDTFMRRGLEGIDSAEDRALVAARYSQSESRAEGVATGSAGGYLVPQGFWQNLVIAMKAYGGLINLATIIETSTGNPLPWPSTDDTSNLGSILGENVASLQLMQDSAFDLDSFITGRLSERIGRAVAQHLVNGTGTAQPQGVLASGAVTNNTTLPTGNTVKLTYAGLVALSHSIDPAYRASGNARFLMSDAALSQVRQIVDGQGRPLWTPDYLGQGDRDVILGYPVTIDQSVPVPAANAISVVFGDFKAGYVVRRALGLQLLRLTERYADFLQVGFIGFMRLDGKVNDPRALATLTQSGT
jgi:predicted phage gp36 major capsid-like protein